MMSNWLTQHRLTCAQVLARMWRAPVAMLTMASVIGVTLCLPALLYVAIDNLQRFAGNVGNSPQISLFLALDAKDETIKDIGQRLKNHEGIDTHRFVARDAAWQDLQKNSGLGELAGGLEQNPLPDAYIVQPKDNDPAAVERLQQEMQQWPDVELAQLDAAWAKRLHTLIELGNRIVLVVAGLLGFALLVITGNSIRLQILTQREEIALSRLIGATDRFIRRPFLYAGTFYGLGGGIAAFLILDATVWLFNLSVAELAQQYGSDFRLILPAADLALALVGGSALLGWVGSNWAVSRSLAELES
jgi:cell division transport system permease protein